MSKPLDFWMDTDILKDALERCDLGDGKNAVVRLHPHREMLPRLTHVIEKRAYDELLRVAKDACDEIKSQKTMWPGEVDTLIDLVEKLHSRGSGE